MTGVVVRELKRPIYIASDAHNGNPRCDKGGLNRMLDEIKAVGGSLIDVGDGLDFWLREWTKLLTGNWGTLKKKREVCADYVVGNHDIELREFRGVGESMFGVNFHHPNLIRQVDGRIWLIEHGHRRGILGPVFKAMERLERTKTLSAVSRKVVGSRWLHAAGSSWMVHDSIKADLGEYARKIGADVVVFGHTHKAQVAYENGITFVNPGSSIDRHTYVVYDGERFELRGGEAKNLKGA